MSYNQNIAEKTELLRLIRNVILKKKEYQPAELSEEEFGKRHSSFGNYHLQKSLSSIWDINHIPKCDAVVVQKRYCRDGGKPYLVFEDAGQFASYIRSCISLGTSAYLLFEDRIAYKLKNLAKQYGLSETEYEEVQNSIERGVGLYFSIEDNDMTDERLAASLSSYMKRLIPQKASSIYGRLSGKIVYIDEYNFDFAEAPDSEKSLTAFAYSYDNVEIDKLLVCVRRYIDKLSKENVHGTRFDIKDNLMPQVAASKNAVQRFLAEYYSNIIDRVSLWRPVSFAYQLVYSFENGIEYLKNPTFISACKDTSLQNMLDKQIEFSGTYGNTVIRMNAVSEKIAQGGLYSQTLKECASSTEQIGKALSKELRTEEALSALTGALVVSALETVGDYSLSRAAETEGEEYHE